MTITGKPIDKILSSLQERAKELNCLYTVDELIAQHDLPLDDVLYSIVEAIPPGFQYPEVCQAKIQVEDKNYTPRHYAEAPWQLCSEIRAHGEVVGRICVQYTEQRPSADEGTFLKEERRLITTLAERLGFLLSQRTLGRALETWRSTVERLERPERSEWWIILDFLRRTDHHLLMRLSRRMINHLCWTGVQEAQELLGRFSPDERSGAAGFLDDNRPMLKHDIAILQQISNQTFKIAARHLSEAEIVSLIQRWIKEDKASFLVNTLESQESSLGDIVAAVERFQYISVQENELPPPVRKILRASLVRRLFTEDLNFINVAKNFIGIDDFYHLLRHIVFPAKSHGKLGGKSAGLFLAEQIVRRATEFAALLEDIKVPRTWYLTSDALLQFVHYNDLEDLFARKYLHIDQIRQDYPHVVQVFKNSHFPPEIVQGLGHVLDDFDDCPLIVRSSSLLEDRSGTAFSGKYKSLFLANQGSKKERLAALLDAIAEVYASIFSPDPIEYRAERGLLDVHEEMGIMIQEVVGTRVGPYFMPAFAGVAFSQNEFRWSPRIQRDDGLIRMVPGLGSRAVDRTSSDYPVLVAPGQPKLKVNTTPEEIARYSPTMVDVINLETNSFETVSARELFREYGGQVPDVDKMVSLFEDGRIHRPPGMRFALAEKDPVVTFDGLVGHTPFVAKMNALLRVLREKLGKPVDIEFASDGKDFYLLQCRPQSHLLDSVRTPIPPELPPDKVVFSAERYVSNGRVPDITHVVYVVPEAYAEVPELETLKRIGRAVGKLNALLPKRQFILLGPGRWGSRGDIKLGVNVTYSDINNTAMLIEVARQKGSYVPDLSFGTHFFQDLVEAGIRYLPLYPDDDGVAFNEEFLLDSPNIFADLVPDLAALADVIRVIDVPAVSDGQVLRVLMDGDEDEAVAYLAPPMKLSPDQPLLQRGQAAVGAQEEHWRWRLRMAERIAAQLDAARFGVAGFYVFGSVKNATAGVASDIDLLVHVRGDDEQRGALMTWLDGWSRALSEMNFLRTGHETDGLLDVHLVTDDDISRQTSFAAKIGAVTDAARKLPVGGERRRRAVAPPAR
jgi:hypothetical protein